MSDNRTLQSLTPIELRSRAWYYRQMAHRAPASVRAKEALLKLAEEYRALAKTTPRSRAAASEEQPAECSAGELPE